MDCWPPGFSVHEISQAGILEWVAISFSRGSSRPRNWTHVSCIGRQILYHWGTWEAPSVSMVFLVKGSGCCFAHQRSFIRTADWLSYLVAEDTQVGKDLGPYGLDGKESTCGAGDWGSIPGSGRCPAEGNGNPLQYSGLENSIDKGAWQATVHGVTMSQIRLSN